MIFRCGDLRVDDARLELHDGERLIAVEPRVLETLIYLIRHCDRLVSKDELLREVWKAEHVSDSAVSRCIMEARRAVGDDGSRREIIRTVHGRGYRFVAPVEVESGDSAGKLARARSPRPMVIVGALVLLALALALVFPRGEESPPPPQRVVVVSSVAADDENLEWLAQAMDDALELSLASIPTLDALEAPGNGEIDPAAILSGGVDEMVPDAVLTARFSAGAIQGFARIEMRLQYLLDSGAVEQTPLVLLVVPQLNPGRAPERFDSIRQIVAGMVVSRLSETLERRGSGTPADREAWQLYLRAVNQWEPTCDAAALLDLLDRALELQPEFLPAWYMLGGVRITQAKFCSGATGAVEHLEEVIVRLAELAPDSATPEALRANLLLYQGRTEDALTVLEEAAARFGEDDVALRIGRSTVLRYAGFLVASRRLFDQAMEQYPALPYVAGLVPYAYRYQGEWDGFMEFMPGIESPHYRFYRGLAESVRGNHEAAVAALEPAFEAHPGDLYGRLCQAQLAILRGDLAEARVMLDQLARQRSGPDSLDGEVTFEIGQLMVAAGDRASGIEQLALAVDQGFFCGACLENDVVLRSLAAVRDFDALVTRARQRQLDFAERFGLP